MATDPKLAAQLEQLTATVADLAKVVASMNAEFDELPETRVQRARKKAEAKRAEQAARRQRLITGSADDVGELLGGDWNATRELVDGMHESQALAIVQRLMDTPDVRDLFIGCFGRVNGNVSRLRLIAETIAPPEVLAVRGKVEAGRRMTGTIHATNKRGESWTFDLSDDLPVLIVAGEWRQLLAEDPHLQSWVDRGRIVATPVPESEARAFMQQLEDTGRLKSTAKRASDPIEFGGENRNAGMLAAVQRGQREAAAANARQLAEEPSWLRSKRLGQ